MGREIESTFALPPCRDIRIDGGDYTPEEHIFFEPVDDMSMEFALSGTTGTWNVHQLIWAWDGDFHADVVYFVAFLASAAVAGVYEMHIGTHVQKIYVDTTTKWIFIWCPLGGEHLYSYGWYLTTGNIEITKIHLLPCLPTVTGAGFENLDTDTDEENSVIGKITYTPIPSFVDLGSCKLYGSVTESERLYGEHGIYKRLVMHNEKVKIYISLDNDPTYNEVKIYHKRITYGLTISWKDFGNIKLTDVLGVSPYGGMFTVLENKPHIIRVLLSNDNPATKEDSLEFIIRRGENHVEIKRRGATGNLVLYTSILGNPARAEFGWNGDVNTDPLRKGVVAGGLYTTDRTEEFRLRNTTPEFSNHYGFLWKKDQYSFTYLTCQDIRQSMTAPTFSAYKTIRELTNFSYVTAGTILDPSIYYGATWFSDWLRREAESADILNGSVAGLADPNAYGGSVLNFTAAGANVVYHIAGQSWESKFPDGRYAIAIRTWYEGAFNASLQVYVEDVTGASSLYNQSTTITTETFYGEEWIVIEDANFMFGGDNFYRITLTRNDGNAGDLYVDALIFIPLEKNGNTQGIRFPEGKDGVATALLKEAKLHPEYDKRR